MPKSAELRAEATRLRAIAVGVTDTEVLIELQTLIAELERRAREHDNGSADEAGLHGWPVPSAEGITWLVPDHSC
jgi:hypothetical protein